MWVIRCRRVPVFLAVLAGGAAMASSAFAGGAPVGVLSVGPAQTLSGTQPALQTPARPAGAFINRPTMPLSAYEAAKAGGAANFGMGKPAAGRGNAPLTTLAATAVGFQGISQSGSDGFIPSGVNGVQGGSYNVLTTNDRFVVYSRSTTPVVHKNVSLNTFFSYGTEAMFDPRVVYDPQWKRFVTAAAAFEESGTVQILGLSITKGAAPTGATWNYLLNGKQICGSDVFVDYPQISTTQDAVLLTVDCFRNSDGAYLGSRAFAVAKSILYNGLGFSVPVFTPGNATATPPNVLDGNPRAHLLVSGAGTAVRDVTWTDPQSGFYSTMSAPVNITGFQTVVVPPDAHQSGCSVTSCQIDTGDGRFISPSTQVGDDLWNATTYGFAGGTSFAAPYWGDFDVEGAGADTTKQFGVRFLSSNSDDYNVSLVAGGDGSMFMNWSSSSPTAFVSEVVAARKSTDTAGTLPTLLVPFTSSATLTGNFDAALGVQNWGHTSQITRDTNNSTVAWSWNQIVAGSSEWGTFSAKFVVP
jgi:hypothetical protein